MVLASLIYGMVIALPGLIIPAIIGSNLWRSSTPGDYRRMLALFALKPWITTPLFLMIVPLTSHDLRWMFAILPGLIVTIILIRTFAPILRARPGIALLILVGDAARWSLATESLYSDKTPSYMWAPSWEAVMPALVWTSVYALLCWGLAWYDARQAAAPATG